MRELRKFVVPASAGNVNVDVVNDGLQPLCVAYGQVSLTTDATVANRRVVIQVLDDQNAVTLQVSAGAVVTASLAAQRHSFGPDLPREAAFVNNDLMVPIPSWLILPPGFKLRVSVASGVAGDSFSGQFIAAAG